MSAQKAVVTSGFQNQNTLNYLYITANTNQNDQRVYQMMFNTQIIELALKTTQHDTIVSVNATSRQRELLGVIDAKNFTLYKNDKGNLTKLY